jgi:hypothetical protein
VRTAQRSARRVSGWASMDKTLEPLTLRTDDGVIWIDQYLNEAIGHQSIAVSTNQVALQAALGH